MYNAVGGKTRQPAPSGPFKGHAGHLLISKYYLSIKKGEKAAENRRKVRLRPNGIPIPKERTQSGPLWAERSPVSRNLHYNVQNRENAKRWGTDHQEGANRNTWTEEPSKGTLRET